MTNRCTDRVEKSLVLEATVYGLIVGFMAGVLFALYANNT